MKLNYEEETNLTILHFPYPHDFMECNQPLQGTPNSFIKFGKRRLEKHLSQKRGHIMMNDILGQVCSHVDHIWPNQTWIVIHHYCPLHIRGLVLTQYCVRDWHSL